MPLLVVGFFRFVHCWDMARSYSGPACSRNRKQSTRSTASGTLSFDNCMLSGARLTHTPCSGWPPRPTCPTVFYRNL